MTEMFSAGMVVPWHGLGTSVADQLLAEEAIKTAKLDWEVSKRDLQYVDNHGLMMPVRGHKAVVRNDSGLMLGIVTDAYQPVQNKQAFNFMDELIGPGRLATYDTAGSLAGGRKVWMLAKVTDLYYEPVPGDKVEPYLLLSNGHDGKMSVNVAWTSVRVVCQNTLNLALGTSKTRVTIRHTGDVGEKLKQSQEILGLTRKVVQRTQEKHTLLATKKVDTKVWANFLEDMVPLPTDADQTRAKNVRTMLTKLFEEGPGVDIAGVKGTAWAALNAVTAFTTHVRSTRGQNKQEKRLESVWYGSGDSMNQQAEDLLLSAY